MAYKSTNKEKTDYPAEIKRLEEEINSLTEIAMALSQKKNRDKLFKEILTQVRQLTRSDGGALFLVEDKPNGKEHSHDLNRITEKQLLFKVVQNDTLPQIEKDFEEMTLEISDNSLVGYCVIHRKIINIEDAYQIDASLPFSHDQSWDKRHNYRTRSILVVPVIGTNDDVLGVIELVNRKVKKEEKLNSVFNVAQHVCSFDHNTEQFAQALASQAAVALENQKLFAEQRNLMESFIQMIAGAIDSKSPYTGKHCSRVPMITEMLAKAACESNENIFKDFDLTQEEWYELHIAAWLHDCGKVTTPVHVMDKATKLETIYDRIETVKSRFEILKREIEIDSLKQQLANPEQKEKIESECTEKIKKIDEDLEFLCKTNIGSEFLPPESQKIVAKIGQQRINIQGEEQHLLSEDEIANLSISKGTLNEEERLIINGHMVETTKMLQVLPFPESLRRVPEYACGHHEKMDGSGYPKGIYAGDMSIPARIMAIADVFEALTATDRPYKKAKTLSETMRIMGFMKKDSHLDPDIFDLFITSKVYLEYAKQNLSEDLIDKVDEEALLAIEPASYELPEKSERDKRWLDFLPEYRTQ